MIMKYDKMSTHTNPSPGIVQFSLKCFSVGEICLGIHRGCSNVASHILETLIKVISK
jgi:hypothetical protein